MTNNTTATLTDEQRIARQLLDDSVELSARGYRVTAENMERAAALLTSPRAAVPAPEGWKLVPVKPTAEMWAAWDRAPSNEDDQAERNGAFALMLDAAPSAPVADEWDASQQAYIESLAEPAQAVAADGEPLVRNLSPLERVEEDIVVMTRMSNDTKRLPMEETESLARLLYYIEDLRRAAVSPATSDERAAFEAYMTRKGYVCKTHMGGYVSGDVSSKWNAWRAAWAIASQAAAPQVNAADERAALLQWATERWDAEVKQRPLINVHRRSLDDTWRQVIRHCGGDDVSLLGPRHDALLAANPIKTTERDPSFIDNDLDFEPDAQHAVADMANIGYALMQTIERMVPGYCWNESPTEIVGDLLNERDEARASQAAAPADARDMEDPVLVPRGLLGAACAAIVKKHPAPKTLALLREITQNAKTVTVPADAGEALAPSGYAYRYPCGNGTVIRFNNGDEINGSRPLEAVPYWLGAQGGKGGEA